MTPLEVARMVLLWIKVIPQEPAAALECIEIAHSW